MNTKSQTDKAPESFDEHIERCLAMILHYEEVQEIVKVIKKVHEAKLS